MTSSPIVTKNRSPAATFTTRRSASMNAIRRATADGSSSAATRTSASRYRGRRSSYSRPSAPGSRSSGRVAPPLAVRRRHVSSVASRNTSVPLAAIAPRFSASQSAPPPSAITALPRSASFAIAPRSSARKASSPSSSTMRAIGRPASASTSASTSALSPPRSAASSGATVDFPAPGGPHSHTLSGMRGALPRRDALAQFVHRVAAELLEHGAGEDERQQRLADHGRRGDRADVAALDVRAGRLTGAQVDGGERLHQRRDRLHRGADDDGLAGAHPAFDAARAIAPIARQRALAGLVLVVRRRARTRRGGEAEPQLDAFDRVEREKRAPDLCFEPAVPLRVRSEADRDAARDDLEDAAQRIARDARALDLGDHRS